MVGTLLTRAMAPPVRARLLARPDLFARLDNLHSFDVVLLIAPPGFGKTTLLSSWLHHGEVREHASGEAFQRLSAPTFERSTAPPLHRFAWLSLDEADNDPTRFWIGVIAALDQALSGIGEHAASMLRSPQPPPLHVVVEALLEDLYEYGALFGAVRLVLDDYQAIANPLIHRSVELLVEQLPPGMQLVLASREEPPLPLARWRVNGVLAELRVAELRFTQDEGVSFLTKVMGLALPTDVAVTLVNRSEGWPAALQLAALSLREGQSPATIAASFRGSHRHLVDYLAAEVLQRQPPSVQCFLLYTALCERFCTQLADALLEEGDWVSAGEQVFRAQRNKHSAPDPFKSAQEILAYLDQATLFVVPLDAERCWYRYHTLFGEFLRERLQRIAPAQVPQLLQRAARWYEAQGEAEVAIGYWLRGDPTAAASLIEHVGRKLLLRSEIATVLGWLDQLPPDFEAKRPGLALLRAWGFALSGDLDAVELVLQRIEAVPTVHASAHSEVLAVRATVAGLRREITRTIELAQRARAELPEDSVLVRAVVALMLGTASYLSGAQLTAIQAFDEAALLGQRGELIIVALFALHQLGLLYRASGQLGRAAQAYERALAYAKTKYPRQGALAERPIPVAGAVYVGLGMLKYEWNELDEAERLLSQGLLLGRQGRNLEILMMAPIWLARLSAVRGQRGQARQAIAEALVAARQTGVQRLNDWLESEQARLAFLIDDPQLAFAWDRERRLDPAGPVNYLEEIDLLALAQVLVARDDLALALDLLTRLLALAEAEQRLGSVIEILALLAITCAAAGDKPRARRDMLRALRLAAPEGYQRTLLDLGAPCQAVLSECRNGLSRSASPGLADYLERLLAAFPARVASIVTPEVLIEPLSPRELEVLLLVEQGLSNQDIADRLIVGLSTAKKHINNIFGKLGVNSRTQALARARQLGLL
jgi:LuxR family maltose regulon positive regulatory protein